MQFKDTTEDLILDDVSKSCTNTLLVKETVDEFSQKACVSFNICNEEVYVPVDQIPDLIEKLNNFVKHR